MKLVNLYLISVVVMIGFLAASTMWQYSQFQTNVKNLSFNLPQELTGAMPNANEQLAQMMGQIQSQAQQPAQTATSTAETKQYASPDNSFTFNYPADWVEATTQTIEDTDGEILFHAYKITSNSTVPLLMNYLFVKKSFSKTKEEAIDEFKKNAKKQGIPVKISESEIINGEMTTPVIKLEYALAESNTGINIDITLENAIIGDNNPYIISIIAQNNDSFAEQEADKIFKSIDLIKNDSPKNKDGDL